MVSVPFHMPEAWKRWYLFWEGPPCITVFIGKSLLTSLFTFFLISIWLNSKMPWPYIWTKCKSWKIWLNWAICAIFSSIQAILKEISAIKNCKIAVAKKLMNHTFSVKFWVFRREFLRNYSVYWAQIFRDYWNCYVLSILRVFILLASSDSDKHMLMRPKV